MKSDTEFTIQVCFPQSLQKYFKKIKIYSKIYKITVFLILNIHSIKEAYKKRKEHRLSVFENRVLRIIFRPKRNKVTGEWTMPNEELHILYSSRNIIRQIKSRLDMWHAWERRRICTRF
jgi:hypothetical protein